MATAKGGPRGGLGHHLGPRASYSGVVRSAPFEARWELVEAPGVGTAGGALTPEGRATGRVYRASGGRVRTDYRFGGGEAGSAEVIIITDRAARTATALDVAARVASRFPDMGGGAGTWPVQGWALHGAWASAGETDRRTIEGLVCRKMMPAPRPPRLREEQSLSGEIWISEEIKFSVLEDIRDGSGEHHWRLYDIRRVKPDESLFVIPAGYREITGLEHDKPPAVE